MTAPRDIKNALRDVRFHAGIGFAQAYLPSGARLHFWSPEFPVEAESFGLRHNHRFDMHSTVLMGTVIHTPLELEIDPQGSFRRFSVLAAHHGVAEPPKIIDNTPYSLLLRNVEVYHAGEAYFFPKKKFHQSSAVGETMTLVVKSNQEDFRAEIIAPVYQAPKHGLDHTVSKFRLDLIIWRMIIDLPPAQRELIEPHLVKL